MQASAQNMHSGMSPPADATLAPKGSPMTSLCASLPSPRVSGKVFFGVCFISVGAMLIAMLLPLPPSVLGDPRSLSVISVFACLVVALANGANDIANSVGTSYGAGALSLRQAIMFGAAAEFLGAMTLGSFVAKNIAKGIIDPSTYAADDACQGPLVFGIGMLAVLVGTGSTTLLATLYGLPISASHGAIGGLIAVGLASKGSASLGYGPIIQTVVAWVASPLLGALTSAAMHAVIHRLVHSSRDPPAAAESLQPVFVAFTVGVAAAFIILTGPDVVKVKPASLALTLSCALGIAAGALSLLRRMRGGKSRGGLGTPSSGAAAGAGGGGGTGGGGAELSADVEARLKLRAVGDHSDAVSPPASPSPPHSDDDSSTGARTGGARRTATRGGDAPASMGPSLSEAERAAEAPFVPLLILSALTVAFAHGGNDVGNSIGPLADVLLVTHGGDISGPPPISLWLLALGSLGFVLGILTLGSRTILAVGGKITRLTPSRSFAVQVGTSVAVLSSTALGLAVSTSHCLVGAVIGVGVAGRLGAGGGELNLGMLGKIVVGWLATIPLAMLVAVVLFAALKPIYLPHLPPGCG